MNRKIDPDFIDIFYNHGVDLLNNALYIGSAISFVDGSEGGVDWALAENAIKGLHLLSKTDKPITIILNNPGGEVVEGLAIYDWIKKIDNHVTIVGSGKIYSMAGYIMQAGDVRQMTENSAFMLHEGSTEYYQNHPRINKKWIAQDDKWDKMLFDLYYEKIKEKNPKFSKKRLEEMLMFDTILSAQEAKELNLIDEVV